MRFWATSCCQRRMATWSKLVCPDFTTRVPSSRKGLRTLIAPSKKNLALLSSGEPAKSSTLSGPLGALSSFLPSLSVSPRPYSSALP